MKKKAKREPIEPRYTGRYVKCTFCGEMQKPVIVHLSSPPKADCQYCGKTFSFPQTPLDIEMARAFEKLLKSAGIEDSE